jgi:hypothetical protein
MSTLGLRPIPTQPWNERPDELPLDVEECRTALWHAAGNVSEAATILKVTSNRLRNFVKGSAYLTAEADEFRQRIVDKAESVVVEALHDPDRADPMARFVLSSLGKARGYNQNSANKGNITIGDINISWGDGTPISGEVPAPGDSAILIDGTFSEEVK